VEGVSFAGECLGVLFARCLCEGLGDSTCRFVGSIGRKSFIRDFAFGGGVRDGSRS
jgi:hypothetical protein